MTETDFEHFSHELKMPTAPLGMGLLAPIGPHIGERDIGWSVMIG